MQDSLELKNAKGYRAKYINALNDAVKQTRIIGGDVEPVEGEGGTHLYMRGWADQGKFQLFAGVAPLNDNLYNVRAVSDGCFFASGQFVKLRNARNTYYVKGGLMPRGSGWYNGVAPSSWVYCRVVILAYGAEYFLAFRFDSTPLWELIDGAIAADEENIAIICTIGEWNNTTKTVTQYISTDIFYGGAGGGTAEAELQPWEIFSTTEVNEQTGQPEDVWWIAHPKWTLQKPYDYYPEGANPPAPEQSRAFESYYPTMMAKMFKGVYCWPLLDVCYDKAEGYTDVYAVLPPDGIPRPFLPAGAGMSCAVDITENPVCIKIGTFIRNGDTITGFVQHRKGALRSRWEETPPYFVEESSTCGQTSYIRYPDGLTGLEEGKTMQKHSFWVLSTSLNGTELFTGERLAMNPMNPVYTYPQFAVWYGNYIWRYSVHWSVLQSALLKDTVTTARLNIETDVLARVLDVPFVERVQVVYPETPLDQGSVDAVNGTVKMLAVENVELNTSTIFRTEAVDTIRGETIEVSE